MFGHSYSRELADIQRRMQHLERRYERLRGAAARTASSTWSSATQATDKVGDAVVAALGDLVDRFRGGASSLGSSRLGVEAGKVGNEALRRLTAEVEHRPLVMLGVAVGVGLLIGMVGRRR